MSGLGEGINFRAFIDIEAAKKTAAELKKVMNDLSKTGIDISAAKLDPKPISEYQKAQLALQKQLADARLEVQALVKEQQALRVETEFGRQVAQGYKNEVEELRVTEQGLKNDFQAGRISLQQYEHQLQQNRIAQQDLNAKLTEAAIKDKEAATALKQHNLEQKKLAEAAREARKANVALSGSYKAAQERLKELGERIKGVQGGFEQMTPAMRRKIKEYNELNNKLKEFDAQMGNHQRNVGNYQRALESLQGTLSTYLGATALLAAGRQVINQNAEISDSLSDVRRTAGLTAQEAENLSEQLKKIDTRTSLKGLIDIAIIGGQLGIAKDQLAGFTSAVNQLAVSLGGELQGGAESIAKSLGVLDNVFGITQANAGDVEKSFNQIGSAILGLGQSGLATGEFLTDFSERVGGLAKQAGLSLPVILSYGAVLEENGVSAEVAGSAFKRLLSSLSTNREKFFAVAQLADANLTLKDFTDTINTDAKRALDLFFAGLAKGGTSTTSFNDILKSLKLTGAGVSQTIAALSNGQEGLNKHIQDATKDFTDATLSAEQYALKNDNLAGSIDKLGNTFVKYTTSGAIGNFFKSIIDYIRISLDEFGKLVNSSSWKEFWSRMANNGGTLYDLQTGFASVSKRTADNQQFLYPQGGNQAALEKKLFDRGEKFNRQYVANLKKTMDEAAELVKKYEEGVANGSVKENNITIAHYKEKYNKAKTYYEDVAALQKKFGFNAAAPAATTATTTGTTGSSITKAQAREQKTALDSQREFQSKIDEINQTARKKKLSDNEREIQDVKDKYAKLTAEAIAFNNDPRNRKAGVRVNASGYAVSQATEIAVINAKNKEEADKKAREEREAVAKQYDGLLKEFGSYADKRKAIADQYEKDILLLSDNAEAKANREAEYQSDLSILDDANVKKLDSYKRLFDGIENMSTDSAKKVVADALEMLKNTKMSAGLRAEIEKLIDNTGKAVSARLPERIINLANEIDRVADAVGGVDSAFGKVLATLGNVVGQVGNIKKGMADLRTAQGNKDVLGQLGAGLGIFGAGMSIVRTIEGIFDKSAEREAAAEKARDVQMKQTEALTKALERQVQAINDAYGTERLDKYNAAINEAIRLEKDYRKQLQGRFLLTKENDKVDASILRGNTSGFSQSDIDWLLKVGVARITGQESIEDLNRLLDSGKLDEATAKIVQGLIDVQKQAKETANALKADQIGTSLDRIADTFVDNLLDGTQDFGKSFEEIIRTSILNGFKGRLIQEQLQGFYDDFAKATSDGNLSDDEVEALRKAYLAASEKAKKNFEDLEKSTGVSLKDSAGNDSAVSKGIKGITSDEASALEGIMRGQYGFQKLLTEQGAERNLLLSNLGKGASDYFRLAMGNFEVMQRVETNTANTVTELKTAVTELKTIAKNTAPTNMRGNGFG